eukprot:CAMPEP_0170600828 /NCGR_PEP_ID=MMETSP0224-20130122/17538_1 /TAXON_ID=285029 /ORGANISM="Togula jolla, Strain CCCM 725" /LENGTH=32 /DNA_ID= /DNA_START= /DNA_END= /DNA_ORIENTATION=
MAKEHELAANLTEMSSQGPEGTGLSSAFRFIV